MSASRRAIWSWALYDWANSAFSTTVMAGFFPLFFKSYWADPADPALSTFWLGMANSGASILICALSPFLGCVADRGTAKKRFLAAFASLGALATGALWLLPQGAWPWAVGFYVAASVGFMGANNFYDSLLPAVAPAGREDRVSSLGYAMGYIGGGLLFGLNVLMYLKPALFGIPSPAEAVKLSFLSVAVWWAVFTLPLLTQVREPRGASPLPLGRALVEGWSQLRETFAHIRRLRVVAQFLLAYWLYIDGVDTIIKMAVDYGSALGFPSSSLITALLIVQFVAFPAAIAYGRLSERIGAKAAILLAIAAYGLVTGLACFMSTVGHFYGLAVSVGLFQGGIQALSRSLYTRLIPSESSAEFFGFYNMLGKFATIIGPALMGTVTALTGSARLGILSVLVLFVSGGWILARLDVDEGRRLARGRG